MSSTQKIHMLRVPSMINGGFLMACGHTHKTAPKDMCSSVPREVDCEECIEVLKKELATLLHWRVSEHSEEARYTRIIEDSVTVRELVYRKPNTTEPLAAADGSVDGSSQAEAAKES